MRLRPLFITAAACTAALPVTLCAQTYVNAPIGQGSGFDRDLSAPSMTAVEFSLGQSVSLKAFAFSAYQFNVLDWAGTLTYTIYRKDGDYGIYPGSVVAQGSTSVLRDVNAQKDDAGNVVSWIEANMSTPLTLGSGSYFFGLTAAPAAGFGVPGWYGRYQAGQGGLLWGRNGASGSWTPTAGQAGLRLEGTPYTIAATTVAPEPATWTLLGTGLLAIGGAVRRRRAAR